MTAAKTLTPYNAAICLEKLRSEARILRKSGIDPAEFRQKKADLEKEVLQLKTWRKTYETSGAQFSTVEKMAFATFKHRLPKTEKSIQQCKVPAKTSEPSQAAPQQTGWDELAAQSLDTAKDVDALILESVMTVGLWKKMPPESGPQKQQTQRLKQTLEMLRKQKQDVWIDLQFRKLLETPPQAGQISTALTYCAERLSKAEKAVTSAVDFEPTRLRRLTGWLSGKSRELPPSVSHSPQPVLPSPTRLDPPESKSRDEEEASDDEEGTVGSSFASLQRDFSEISISRASTSEGSRIGSFIKLDAANEFADSE